MQKIIAKNPIETAYQLCRDIAWRTSRDTGRSWAEFAWCLSVSFHVVERRSAGVLLVAGGARPVLTVSIGSVEFDVAPVNLVGCWWGYVPWLTQEKSLTPQASSLDVVG